MSTFDVHFLTPFKVLGCLDFIGFEFRAHGRVDDKFSTAFDEYSDVTKCFRAVAIT